MADVQANANSEHEMNTAGEENTQNTVAENTQEELKLDFEKAGEIADKRSERATKSAITDYFKQQGLTPEQANQAFADFKAKSNAEKCLKELKAKGINAIIVGEPEAPSPQT